MFNTDNKFVHCRSIHMSMPRVMPEMSACHIKSPLSSKFADYCLSVNYWLPAISFFCFARCAKYNWPWR